MKHVVWILVVVLLLLHHDFWFWNDDRLLFTFGELEEPAQLRAAQRMLDYWRYCVAMVEMRNLRQ